MARRQKRRKAARNAGRNAARRGADFERRVARILDGEIYTGHDGDVDARGYRIECKSDAGLSQRSDHNLRTWHEQINRYRAHNWSKNQRYALAYTGGKSFNNAQVYISVPIEEFDRLTRVDEQKQQRQEIDEFFDKHPRWKDWFINLIRTFSARLSE